jgi:2-C-methyl-D-erythritol 4-phosphate cytidylyltransferase
VDRDGLWAMETPQCFRLDLLRAAYEQVLKTGAVVTDEVSAAQLAGHPVYLVESRLPNPKLTFPEDFTIAERLLGLG